MKGQVTSTHIRKGEPNKCSTCPIALSLQEKLGLSKYDVKVYHSEALIAGKWYDIRRGTRFIYRFDSEMPVKPITYELTLRPNF